MSAITYHAGTHLSSVPSRSPLLILINIRIIHPPRATHQAQSISISSHISIDLYFARVMLVLLLLLLGVVSTDALTTVSRSTGDEPVSPRQGGRIYTQSELVGVPKERRQAMSWVMQSEYAGPTFFDG